MTNTCVTYVISIFTYIHPKDYVEGIVSVAIGLMSRVFANDPGDLDSILGRVIPKTQKVVLDSALLNTQHFKVRITGKME